MHTSDVDDDDDGDKSTNDDDDDGNDCDDEDHAYEGDRSNDDDDGNDEEDDSNNNEDDVPPPPASGARLPRYPGVPIRFTFVCDPACQARADEGKNGRLTFAAWPRDASSGGHLALLVRTSAGELTPPGSSEGRCSAVLGRRRMSFHGMLSERRLRAPLERCA